MAWKHDPDAPHLRLRLKGALLRRLEQAARRNGRPMNAEIVERLERSFAKENIDRVIKNTAEAVLERWGLEQGLLALNERVHKLDPHTFDPRTNAGMEPLTAAVEERGVARRAQGIAALIENLAASAIAARQIGDASLSDKEKERGRAAALRLLQADLRAVVVEEARWRVAALQQLQANIEAVLADKAPGPVERKSTKEERS
jgi:hypothetical protein